MKLPKSRGKHRSRRDKLSGTTGQPGRDAAGRVPKPVIHWVIGARTGERADVSEPAVQATAEPGLSRRVPTTSAAPVQQAAGTGVAHDSPGQTPYSICCADEPGPQPIPDDVLDTPITAIGLDTRFVHPLRRQEIHTVRALVEWTAVSLKDDVRNIGPKAILAINAKLAALDPRLSLKEEEPA